MNLIRRDDLVDSMKRRLIAAHPGELRETDITLTVTECVTAEAVQIVTRPATDEERAQIEIARRIASMGLK